MTPEGQLTVHGSEEVHALTGLTLGPSAWFQVDHERDDRFARAVEDWDWAHNEPERISGEVSAATAITGGEQLAVDLRIDADGAERPACVAQPVWRLYHLGAVS